MMNVKTKPGPAGTEGRLAQRIAHSFFVRFHMSLILTAVIASGVLTSKGLLELGVHSLRLRYPLAVLGSYLMFVMLVRIWIWYVKVCCGQPIWSGSSGSGGSGGGVGWIDFGDGPAGGGGGSGFKGFGGGDSGGGGASSSWDGGDSQSVASGSSVSSSTGSWMPDLDFGGCDDDGWWVLLLLAALVLAVVGAGGYLIWMAPHILPEAATQAMLATGLARSAKQQGHSWINGVFRSTWIPFVLVLIMATVLGVVAQRHCPGAAKLTEVFGCPSQGQN